jgi:hypothetical protein
MLRVDRLPLFVNFSINPAIFQYFTPRFAQMPVLFKLNHSYLYKTKENTVTCTCINLKYSAWPWKENTLNVLSAVEWVIRFEVIENKILSSVAASLKTFSSSRCVLYRNEGLHTESYRRYKHYFSKLKRYIFRERGWIVEAKIHYGREVKYTLFVWGKKASWY